MTSKKPASHKRASLPRISDRTKQFVKDWESLTRSGRYNITI
jgi:mRNA interferase YafQ